MSRFNRVAKYYDSFMKKTGYFKEKEIKELLSIDNIDYLLDIGSGTCHYSNYLDDYIKDIYCIDGSQKMMSYGKDSLHKTLADITKGLPYKDNQFDAIIMCDFMHHINKKNQSKLFEEIKRVLRPNGEFIIYDFEGRKFKTKILHIFEFLLFFRRMHYRNHQDIINELKGSIHFTERIEEGYTYIIKGKKL